MPGRSADSQTQLISRVSESVHLLDVAWSKERAQRIRQGMEPSPGSAEAALAASGGRRAGCDLGRAALAPAVVVAARDSRAPLWSGDRLNDGRGPGGALRSEPSSERSAAAALSERKLEGSAPASARRP